uniref:Putative secreted protein n=1 Tax=Anopheles marajoara TaxID=58244 RepID=A0A2M4CEY8_9DIPT
MTSLSLPSILVLLFSDLPLAPLGPTAPFEACAGIVTGRGAPTTMSVRSSTNSCSNMPCLPTDFTILLG